MIVTPALYYMIGWNCFVIYFDSTCMYGIKEKFVYKNLFLHDISNIFISLYFVFVFDNNKSIQ